MSNSGTGGLPGRLGTVGFVVALLIGGLFGLMGVIGGSQPATPAANDATAALDAAEVTAAAANFPVLRAELPATAVLARARFRVPQAGGTKAAYVGPLQMWFDDVARPTLRVGNGDALEFAAPRAARRLRCAAPGCAPVEIALVTNGEGIVDLGDVDLQPAARLSFVASGLPPRFDGPATFTAASADFECTSDVPDGGRNGTATFAFLGGNELGWQAAYRGAHALMVTGGAEPALRADEQRTVVVEVGGLPTRTCRIVGASAPLLRHLVVRVKPANSARSTAPTVEPDAAGAFQLTAAPGATFSIAAADGDVPLTGTETPNGLELRPTAQLLGLVCLDARGEPQPFSCGARPAAKVFVTTRGAHDELLVRLDGGPLRRVRTTDLPSGADHVDLAKVPAQTLGEVAVQLRGELLPGRQLALQLLRADGSVAAVCPVRAGAPLVPALEPGRYELRWSIDGAPGPVAGTGMTIAAGERREVAADVPPAQPWTGEVAGQANAPALRRFLGLRFGSRQDPKDDCWLPVETDGSFRFGLVPGSTPVATADVRCGSMQLAAAEVAIDAEHHHVVVKPPANLHWVDMQVAADHGADWCAVLQRPGTTTPYAVLHPRDQRPVAVPHGTVLGGALFAHEPGGAQLGWFELDGSVLRTDVRAAAGREITFRCERGPRTVVLIGPRGQTGAVVKLTAGAVRKVFVPEGTRGFTGGASDHEAPLPTGDSVIVP